MHILHSSLTIFSNLTFSENFISTDIDQQQKFKKWLCLLVVNKTQMMTYFLSLVIYILMVYPWNYSCFPFYLTFNKIIWSSLYSENSQRWNAVSCSIKELAISIEIFFNWMSDLGNFILPDKEPHQTFKVGVCKRDLRYLHPFHLQLLVYS